MARRPRLGSGLSLAQASPEFALGEGEEGLIAERTPVGAERFEADYGDTPAFHFISFDAMSLA
jgi:hypothetical protein